MSTMRKTKGSGVMPAVMTFWNADESFNQKETERYIQGENEKAKELFVPMYRFCKTTGQNGRILPNSLLRPAIEAVTGIKLGPARLPLAPATEAELDVTLGVLRELGKL